MLIGKKWLAAALVALGALCVAFGLRRWPEDEGVRDATEATCASSKSVGEECKLFIKTSSKSHVAPTTDGTAAAPMEKLGHCYVGSVQKQDLTGALLCRYEGDEATAAVSAVLNQGACALEGDSCRKWSGRKCVKGKMARDSRSDPTLICRCQADKGDTSWLVAGGFVMITVGLALILSELLLGPLAASKTCPKPAPPLKAVTSPPSANEGFGEIYSSSYRDSFPSETATWQDEDSLTPSETATWQDGRDLFGPLR
jgi:hypothetical protein